MTRMVVAIYDSRENGEAARRRLVESGFPPDRIRLEGAPADSAAKPEARSKLEGVARAIHMMFSDFLMKDELSRYAAAARGGKTVIAVRAANDAAAEKAAAILRTARGEIGEPITSEAIPDSEPDSGRDLSAQADPIATLYGPTIYPLPGAPTGWGEAWRGDRSALGSTGYRTTQDKQTSDTDRAGGGSKRTEDTSKP